MISTVQHQQQGHKGIFFLQDDGERIAEMTYTMAGDTRMIIDHTGVDGAYGGQGLGTKLVEAAIFYARESSLTILPLCPFAKAQIQQHTEWQDVLK